MHFVEFIGFVVSLIVMIFLVGKRFIEKRQQHLSEWENENLPSKLKSKPTSNNKFQQPLIKLREAQKLQATHQKKNVVQPGNFGTETARDKKRNLAASDFPNGQEEYEVIRIEKISPGVKLLQSLQSSKDMLIIKEIFDTPLSLRDLDRK